MSTTVMYKGRKYRKVWEGDTKYGRRAKLEFFDGSKSFFCDASMCTFVTNGCRHGGATRGRMFPCVICGGMMREDDGSCPHCGCDCGC